MLGGYEVAVVRQRGLGKRHGAMTAPLTIASECGEASPFISAMDARFPICVVNKCSPRKGAARDVSTSVRSGALLIAQRELLCPESDL